MKLNEKTIIILLLIGLVACGVNKRKKAEDIIQQFEQERVGDKREVVFEIIPLFENGKLIIQGETSDITLKSNLVSALNDIRFKNQITVLPDSTAGEETFGLINLSVANHRSAPSHSAELVTQSLLGTPVRILKKQRGWYYVQTPDNYISWIDDGGIHPVKKRELENWNSGERLFFNSVSGIIYSSAKMTQPLSDAVLGNIVLLLEENRRNFQIKLPDGRQGYIAKENWISFNDFANQSAVDSSKIIKVALQLTGRPYLWGGTSPYGMDCSGFTKTVYFANGIILARDASLQVRHGLEIVPGENYNQFLPGDLLFFGRQATQNTKEKVTHVAISLGSTKFIHASGRVKQNSFHPDSANYSEFRKNSFISAKRIKGAEGEHGIIRVGEHPWY